MSNFSFSNQVGRDFGCGFRYEYVVVASLQQNVIQEVLHVSHDDGDDMSQHRFAIVESPTSCRTFQTRNDAESYLVNRDVEIVESSVFDYSCEPYNYPARRH